MAHGWASYEVVLKEGVMVSYRRLAEDETPKEGDTYGMYTKRLRRIAVGSTTRRIWTR